MLKLKRYEKNPILKPQKENSWESQAVFNPGAIYKDGKVHLLYRAIGEYEFYVSRLGYATSSDGFNFERMSNQPVLEPNEKYGKWAIEDPRISELEGKIYLTYVVLTKPAREKGQIAYTVLAKTKDFYNFERLGIITPQGADDRNTVLFSEKIRGKYLMLHRPQEWLGKEYREWGTGQPSSIWLAFSNDLKKWENHQVLMKPQKDWEVKRINAGPPPIKTNKGWLLIYTGVDKNSVYRLGAALLDLKEPKKVISRLTYPILEPEEDYEKIGDTPNVVFSCGAVIIGKDLFVYYGAADKVCALATTPLDELLEELMSFKN